MNRGLVYDLAVLGNYTKDTIVSPSGTRMVDGGGFNYGAHVGSLMGLKTAAVTRLAKEDARVVEALVQLGVDVFPTYTTHSTHMRLQYATSNVDERVLSVTQTAGVFTPDQVKNLQARVFLINASTRGEVDLNVILELEKKDARLAADAQGFVRIIAPDGTLRYDAWPAKEQVLSHIDILKTDAVEAEALTGQADMRAAARTLAGWGPDEIVLTHRAGVLVLVDGRFHEASFCPRQLVGRSGRGDTCIAAYVAKRLTASPEDATVWAAAVTSLKMEAEGPITRRIEDVQELVQKMEGKSLECAKLPGSS